MAANDDDYDKCHNNQNLAPHPYLHCMLSLCQMMLSSLIGHPALQLHAIALEFHIWNAFPHSVRSGPTA